MKYIVGLSILTTLVNCIKHPSPYNNLHHLSLIQTYSKQVMANEEQYGHLNFCEATEYDFSTHCADEEYTNWVRSELNEWHKQLSKSNDLIQSEKQNLVNYRDGLLSQCQDKGLSSFRGNLNYNGLGEVTECSTGVYTYDNSCLMELIKNHDSFEFDDNLLENNCRHVLKQLDDTISTIEWLYQFRLKTNNTLKEVVHRRLNTVCCHTTCQTCASSATDDCNLCPTTRQHPLTSTNEEADDSCVCQNGFIEYNPQQQNCQECDNVCLTCQDSPQNCLECANGLVKNSSGQCSCPTKHYSTTNSLNQVVCNDCHYTCLECTGDGRQDCTQPCPQNREYKNSECLPVDGFFDESPKPIGQKCHYTCETCDAEGSQNCLTCSDLREFKTISGEHGECNCSANVGHQVDGSQVYYGFDSMLESLKECKPCNASCVTCKGININDCTGNKCPLNKSFVVISDTESTCKPNPGYYCAHCPDNSPLGSQEPGIKCDNLCKTCLKGTSQDCLSCQDDMELTVLDSSNSIGECRCKSGNYYSEEDMNCKPCDTSCKECVGPNQNQCTSCDSANRTFNKLNDLNEIGTCDVNPGFHECVPRQKEPCVCSKECQTCNKEFNCTSCNEDELKELVNGKCECKDGFRVKYQDNLNDEGGFEFSCVPCDNTQETCRTGTSGPNATSCKENRIISTNFNGLQVCVCETGYYSFQDSVKCFPCSSDCNDCDVQEVCTDCKEDSQVLYQGTCTCDPNSFLYNNESCRQCFNACQTCLGSLSSDCVIPTDPNTVVIGDNDKEVHYIFIVESSANMNSAYDATQDTLNYNQFITELINTKYELAKYAVQKFILEKMKLERITQIFDDVSLVNFSLSPVETYWSSLFERKSIESFPESPSEESKANLFKAFQSVVNKIKDQDPNKHKYHIIIIVDGNKGRFQHSQRKKNKYNLLIDLVQDLVVKFQIIQLQSENNETTVGLLELFKEKVNITVTNQVLPSEFVKQILGCITLPSKDTPECIDGYYLDTDKFQTDTIYCFKCLRTCYTCQQSNKCTQCIENTNRSFDENEVCICLNGYEEVNNQVKCFKKCEDNQYRDTDDVCQACDDECSHCIGPLTSDCSECNQGYYLNGSSCSPCKPECNSCNSQDTCTTCKVDTTWHRTLVNEQCPCEEGYKASEDLLELQCYLICKDDQYQSNPLECSDCDVTCSTCSQGDDESCNQCYESQNRTLKMNSCKCDAGWVVNDANECELCSENCTTCGESKDDCTTCGQNMTLDRTSSPNKCMCVTGHYDVFEVNVLVECKECHVTCEQCKGESDKQCSFCNNDQNRVRQGTGETFECVCKPGYSDYDSDNKCEECHHSCTTCTNSESTGCTDCAENRVKQLDGTCKPSPGFHECEVDNKPLPAACVCNVLCLECKDSNEADNCTVCHEDKNYERELPNEETSNCVAKPGYFIPKITGPVIVPALPCVVTCQLCVDSASFCTACDGDKNRVGPSATNTCPCVEHHYSNTADRSMCSACDVTCLTCDGPGPLDCLTCDTETQKRQYNFNSLEQSCVCPKQTYQADYYTCKACSYKCKTCNKAGCTECSNPLREMNQCNPCESCFEPTPGTSEVKKCHYSCNTCTGSLATDCTSCKSDNSQNRVEVLQLESDTGTKGSCPCLEKFYDNDQVVCKACHATCLTCLSETQNSCTSCDLSVYEELNDEGLCTPKCGYSYSNQQGLKSCHCQCECCNSVEKNSCTVECQLNATLSNGVCVPNVGYYWDTCTVASCPVDCLTCKLELSQVSCTACADDFKVLKNGQCECKIGFYLNDENECQECQEKCTSCNGSDKCTECQGQNTVPETCQCLEDYKFDDNGISCSEKEKGVSIVILTFGIITGFDTQGSVQVSSPTTDEQEICVKTVVNVTGNHEEEEISLVPQDDYPEQILDSSAEVVHLEVIEDTSQVAQEDVSEQILNSSAEKVQLE